MAMVGYYDGQNIVTEAKLELNQRVMIIPIENDTPVSAGMLHNYANPDLIPMEKEAWRNAVIAKHS